MRQLDLIDSAGSRLGARDPRIGVELTLAMDELMERYRRHVAGEVSLGDRLAGAVWGHLVGDAVGVPYEFRPPVAADDVRFGATGSHRSPARSPASTWRGARPRPLRLSRAPSRARAGS